MESSQSNRPVIHENKDGEKTYILQCEDNHVIYTQGKQIIEDSKLRISISDWRQEVESMCHHIAQWVNTQATSHITGWILVQKGSQLTGYFCPQSESFDFVLADELADLSIYIVRNFNVGPLELLQIPFKDRGRFIDPKWDLNDGNIGATR